MDFKSVDEIKEHFGISLDETNEIRKELKKRLASEDAHPDKTGGSFKSKAQQRNHDELSNAIDFLDNLSTELVVSKEEWGKLQKTINELVVLKETENLKTKEQFTKLLENHIDESVISFQKRHYTIKITSFIATTVITTIWAFPSLIKNHPILSKILFFDSIPFTIVWISSLLFVGYIWINSKIIEHQDKKMKMNYSVDTTQNIIFKLFCAWLRASKYKNYDYDSKTYNFSRDDLFNFILNHYEKMFKEFGEFYDLSEWELYRKISEKYKDKKELVLIKDKNNLKRKIALLFTRPGEIDIDLAHKLTDTMLQKLLLRNVIELGKKLAFHDTYKYKNDEE